MRRLAIALSVLAAAYSPGLRAGLDQTAFAQFEAGDYAGAAEAAEAAGDADNLALAARALNAAAYLSDDDKTAKRLAKRAAALGDAAVALDPNHIEGYLQGAIAMAQRGARISAVRAFLLGLGGGARERLDAALALDADNPWALSTSGGWHLGVAARAGDGRFGSDAATGLAQFRDARQRAPENISIAYEMALRVLAFGEPAWRDEALAALEAARAAPPQSALDAALQARATAFADAIAAGPEAEAAYIDAQP